MAEALRRGGLTFVKLGGSLITDKRGDESLRHEVLERLAHELAEAGRALAGRLVLGHGSGSFGHAAAVRLGFDPARNDSPQRSAVSGVQDAAARLHRHVISALLAAGACPYSIVPGSAFIATGGKATLVAGELPDRLLVDGFLPVLYGDVVVGSETAAILSTEALFLELAKALTSRGYVVERVLWLGETDGVLDGEGRRIDELTAEEASELARAVEGAAGTDVTGGIKLRLATVVRLARLGVPSLIADGRVPGVIGRALGGDSSCGTAIWPTSPEG